MSATPSPQRRVLVLVVTLTLLLWPIVGSLGAVGPIKTAAGDATGNTSGNGDMQSSPFAGGTGTADDPYQIATVEQLQRINQSLSANYTLISDIDASETTAWNNGSGFRPIGKEEVSLGNVEGQFNGTFDGRGHTISNLYINRTPQVGLFASVGPSGTIRNLTLSNASITGSGNVGAVAALSWGQIIDIHVDANVDSGGGSFVGGVVGYQRDGQIKNVSMAGMVQNGDSTGGVVGIVAGREDSSPMITNATSIARIKTPGGIAGGVVGDLFNGQVIRSSATGDVSGDDAGGLIGRTGSDASVTRSYSTGKVEGSAGNSAGGLVGIHDGRLSNTYSTGAVKSDSAGGLVGSNAGEIYQSYSTGPVDGRKIAGGLVGDNQAIVSTSFSTGMVSGEGDIGGLIGRNSPGPGRRYVSRSYWDRNTSGQSNSAGGVGLTTAEMTGGAAVGNMSLDFIRTFELTDSYPILTWQQQLRFAGGTGTVANPYQIASPTQLQRISQFPTANFTVIKDIDAAETATWNGGDGFAPIGNRSVPFSGTIKGNDNVITELTIDRETEDRVGLFGVTEGTITDLTLARTQVTGGNDVGGMAGVNDGTVRQSSVRGNITSRGKRVGGLLGVNRGLVMSSSARGSVTGLASPQQRHMVGGGLIGSNVGAVSKSSASVDVTGGQRLGGLIGEIAAPGKVTPAVGASERAPSTVANSSAFGNVSSRAKDGLAGGLVGTITTTSGGVSDSFSTGQIDDRGPDGSDTTGGLIGAFRTVEMQPGQVTDSYWDIEASGESDSQGGIGLTTAEMTGLAARNNMTGLAFGDIWQTSDKYPFLPWQQPRLFAGGIGTEDDPYRIATLDQLRRIGKFRDANFLLINDIDATPTRNSNGGAGFNPIGSFPRPFTGSLDGGDQAITGLYINRSDEKYVGLFRMTEGATLEDLRLSNVNVTGVDSTGALVGYSRTGEIVGASAEGKITANSNVGGLVGYNNRTRFNNVTVAVDVVAVNTAGGVIGYNQRGTLVQARVSGNITPPTGSESGSANLGGLVGYNQAGNISESSTEGIVRGDSIIGGLVGFNSGGRTRNGGTIERSAATANVTGVSGNFNSTVGGLVGYNFDTVVRNSYASGAVKGKLRIGGLIGTSDGSEIIRSFAAGPVRGNQTVGGLVGENLSSTATDSYWDTEATKQPDSPIGTGLTTARMTGNAARGNMSGFDFENTWTTTDSYPILSWQTRGEPVAFTVTPPQPAVNETVSFDATVSPRNGSIRAYNWSFGDNTTADGAKVEHVYNQTGEVTVTFTATFEDGTNATVTETIEVRPSEQLVVDADGEEGNFTSIQAAVDNASDTARIEVLPGTYNESVTVDKNVTLAAPDGATVGFAPTSGFGFDAFVIPAGSRAAPTIDGFTVPDIDLGTAVRASGTRGDWTVRNLTADGTGIVASESNGAWRITDSLLRDPNRDSGVVATDTTGDWRISDTRFQDVIAAVNASASTGDWRIRAATVTMAPNSIEAAIDAVGTTGDWRLTDIGISGTAGIGVHADRSSGAWLINGTSRIEGTDTGISAIETAGDWQIHRTNIVSTKQTINASGADLMGNARRNWWGEFTPKSFSPDCIGNVTCANPLGEPASRRATGIQLRLTNGSGAPIDDIKVVTYSLRRQDERRLVFRLDDLSGRERLGEAELPDDSLRNPTTGPEGLVRLTGLTPDVYCLLLVPPDEEPANIRTVCPVGVSETDVTRRTPELTDSAFLDGIAKSIDTLNETADKKIKRRIAEAASAHQTTSRIFAEEAVRSVPDALPDSIRRASKLKSRIDQARSVAKGDIGELAKSIAKEITIGAYREHLEQLAAQRAARLWTLARNPDNDSEITYEAQLADEQWVRDFELFDNPTEVSRKFDKLRTVRTARRDLNSSVEEFNQLRRGELNGFDNGQPPEEFNRTLVQSIVERQTTALKGNGLAEGVVVAPTGNVYTVDSQNGTQRVLEQSQRWVKANRANEERASFINWVGGNMIIPKVSGRVQAIGTTLNLLFRTSRYAAELHLMTNSKHMKIATLRDIDHIATVESETVDWLKQQYESPVSPAKGRLSGTPAFEPDVNGVHVVKANRPTCEAEDPTFCKQKRIYQGTADVTIKNTGEQPADARLLLIPQHYSGNGDGPRGTSGLATVFPPQGDKAGTLAPNESVEVPVDYKLDNPVEDPFRLHVLHTVLVMEGQVVDVESNWTFVNNNKQGRVELGSDGTLGYKPRDVSVPDTAKENSVGSRVALSRYSLSWPSGARSGAFGSAATATHLKTVGPTERVYTVNSQSDIQRALRWGQRWVKTLQTNGDRTVFTTHIRRNIQIPKFSEEGQDIEESVELVSRTTRYAARLQSVINPGHIKLEIIRDINDIVPLERGPVAAQQSTGPDENQPQVRTVIDENLGPGFDSVETTVRTGENTDTVSVLLITKTGAQTHMRVVDPQGRIAGWNPVTRQDETSVPNATYSGSEATIERVTLENGSDRNLRVNVTGELFEQTDAVPVEVLVVESPDIPALIAMERGTVQLTLANNDTRSSRVTVYETGHSKNLENVLISVGPFTTEGGRTLPDGSVTAEEGPALIESGESSELDLTVGPVSALQLPETERTRFNGPISVNASNAGNVTRQLSVLVLDTSLPGIDLASADPSVSGVHFDAGAVPANAPDPPGEVAAAYETSVLGEGTASITIPNSLTEPGTKPVRLTADGWVPVVNITSGNETTIVAPEGQYPVVFVKRDTSTGRESPPQSDTTPSAGTDGGDTDAGGGGSGPSQERFLFTSPDYVERIDFDSGVPASAAITISETPNPSESTVEAITAQVANTTEAAEGDGTLDVIAVIDISPSAAEAKQTPAAVEFEVPRDELDNPNSVFLVHRTDDGWERIETTVQDAGDGSVSLLGEVDSFSLFAIVEVSQPQAGTPTTAGASTPSSEQSGEQTAQPSPAETVAVTTSTPESQEQVQTTRLTPTGQEAGGFPVMPVLVIAGFAAAVLGVLVVIRRRNAL